VTGRRRIGDMRRATALGAVTIALIGAASADASCIFQTTAEQRARADVIFDGVALDRPTASGVQRFKVRLYRKGRGPTVVRVQTGNRVFADGSGSTTSVSIVVRKGQRWRIFARGSAQKILQTNVCDGSRRL
jgi:hypothetical protein